MLSGSPRLPWCEHTVGPQPGAVDHLEQEIALLREEIRFKASRMERIPASECPQYLPTERLAILELAVTFLANRRHLPLVKLTRVA